MTNYSELMPETVRELKELGIDIYFERENIHTLSGDGEFMLTIFASFSQEESRSVSENCKWSVKKQFEQGKPVGLRFMYGYINEKYTGNSLLQKKYTTDHLTKKTVKNRGERTQYYAEDTHPAIIDEKTYRTANAMVDERKKRFCTKEKSEHIRYTFTGRITCSLCGKKYRRRIIREKIWWVCGTRTSKDKCACPSVRIPEDTLNAVTAGVLGLPAFDESVFLEEIVSILAGENNTLRFTFSDGREVSAEWNIRSRRRSWTDEMKKAASDRQKIIAQRRKAENANSENDTADTTKNNRNTI